MAERRGTSTRGGVATDPASSVNLDDFAVVETGQEITRSRLEPSEYEPLVDLAIRNLGRKIEETRPVMDGDKPKVDENGKQVRAPRVYSYDEAKAYEAALVQLRSRKRLPDRGLSLRILGQPALSKIKPGDEVRMQFYIINRNAGKDGQTA